MLLFYLFAKRELFSFSDAVIIGASSVKHLEENLKSAKHGPLHEDVVALFEEAWGQIKGDCPYYFR